MSMIIRSCGIRAQRPGPRARRRPLSRRVALQPHGRPARDFARLHHAALLVAADAEIGDRHAAVAAQCAAPNRRAVSAGFEKRPGAERPGAQADKVVANLKLGSVKADADKEIIALIAYLQRLGTDIKSAPVTAAANKKAQI